MAVSNVCTFCVLESDKLIPVPCYHDRKPIISEIQQSTRDDKNVMDHTSRTICLSNDQDRDGYLAPLPLADVKVPLPILQIKWSGNKRSWRSKGTCWLRNLSKRELDGGAWTITVSCQLSNVKVHGSDTPSGFHC